MENTNVAPFPDELAQLIADVVYKPGWSFYLSHLDRGQGSAGLTLDIIPMTTNSYDTADTEYQVHHYFPVPPAAYDARAWRRWLFEQLVLVETHEAMEFFQVGGDRPYAPSHGPGNNPYTVREIGTLKDQTTSFRGE